MRSLYIRIYLTVIAALALFALVSGWLLQRHLDDQREQQRSRIEASMRERAEAWGDLLEKALPPASDAREVQAQALRDWSQRLRLPMALDDAQGQRIGRSDSWLRRELDEPANQDRVQSVTFEDGRRLWLPRTSRLGMGNGPGGPGGPGGAGQAMARAPEMQLPLPRWLGGPRPWPEGWGIAALLLVIFLAVGAGAYPVVRRLTRRLEALKRGVEAFGAGQLQQRVAEEGRDEVAAVAASFNQAAARIEALLRSHQNLLANASHELRSPLARLKMAMAMMDSAGPEQKAALRREIDTNVAELDALVEEVLLASRLDASTTLERGERVDLLGLAAEEAVRVGAEVQGEPLQVQGNERLLRRALRNLLENGRRYGGDEVDVEIAAAGAWCEVRVRDRGPGVPMEHRERIFEAFFRLPGHAEREGGVGLGLSLVRQIAERHGGRVRCEPREGGGSVFVLSLPRA